MKLPPRTSPILDSRSEYIDRSLIYASKPRPIVDLTPARPSPLRRMRTWIGAELPRDNPIPCQRWSPQATQIALWVVACSVAITLVAVFAL